MNSRWQLGHTRIHRRIRFSRLPCSRREVIHDSKSHILDGPQYSTIPIIPRSQNSQKSQTLTGCVQRGEAVSAYKIVDKEKVVWNLSANKKLKLDRYVDHTVIVRGTVVESRDTKSAQGNESTKSSPGNIFNVTKVTVIGPCAK